MGCERLVSMLIDQGLARNQSECEVYLAMQGEGSLAIAHKLAESLRDALPQLNLTVHSGAGSFKSQMRKADKSGAKIALILGESEIDAETVSVKFLRNEKPQIEIGQSEIARQLVSLIE